MINSKFFLLAVISAGFMTLLSSNLYAQDEGNPLYNLQEPGYQELNLNDDKALIYDGFENRPIKTVQSIQRDSIAAQSSRARTVKKQTTDKKEDDALSFNFLYYIIQKYKISDIVDQ